MTVLHTLSISRVYKSEIQKQFRVFVFKVYVKLWNVHKGGTFQSQGSTKREFQALWANLGLCEKKNNHLDSARMSY